MSDGEKKICQVLIRVMKMAIKLLEEISKE
jgi:hypothetical protein